jgi:hypothetical protein
VDNIDRFLFTFHLLSSHSETAVIILLLLLLLLLLLHIIYIYYIINYINIKYYIIHCIKEELSYLTFRFDEDPSYGR